MEENDSFVERTIAVTDKDPETIDEALDEVASICLAFLHALIEHRNGKDMTNNVFLWSGILGGAINKLHRRTLVDG